MDLEALRQLAEPAGWALLADLPPYDEKQSLALGTALRQAGFAPELVSAALTQSRLRARATGKFGDLAADMLFTPDGLEQATRLSVAARHAHRFRSAGVRVVADLGCGIGADALALAGMALDVVAVERDPVTALVAAVNLRQLPEARVVAGDALDPEVLRDVLAGTSTGPVDGVWADPARRTSRGRLHRLEDYSPAVADLLALRSRVPALGMKLGPGIAHRDLPGDALAQWLSVAGDVLEADLWFADLAPEGPGRGAVVVGRDGRATTLLDPGDPTGPITPAPSGPGASGGEAVGRYVFEPDGAIIRAGLVHRVAERLDARLLDPTIAFLTGDRLPADDDTARCVATFRVLDVMPYSLKRLRSYLRERQVGTLEIKKRGWDLDPARLRQQLALRGTASGTIILTRVAGEHRVVVVERVDPPAPA